MIKTNLNESNMFFSFALKGLEMNEYAHYVFSDQRLIYFCRKPEEMLLLHSWKVGQKMCHTEIFWPLMTDFLSHLHMF